MLHSELGARQFVRQRVADAQHLLVLALMGSLVVGFVAVAITLTEMRAENFDTPVEISDRLLLANADELRRCWVPSDRSEPRDCWMVPGEPAKEQRLRIDGDGSLEDCWPHPDEADVDICESPQMAFVV